MIVIVIVVSKYGEIIKLVKHILNKKKETYNIIHVAQHNQHTVSGYTNITCLKASIRIVEDLTN